MLALDGPVAPRLNAGVDLLVQLAHRTGIDARAPQGLRDVLNTADRDARQVHLDERLLDRGLAAPVALDDLGLKREFTEAWHLEVYLAHARLQLPGVAAGPRIDPVRAALV